MKVTKSSRSQTKAPCARSRFLHRKHARNKHRKAKTRNQHPGPEDSHLHQGLFLDLLMEAGPMFRAGLGGKGLSASQVAREVTNHPTSQALYNPPPKDPPKSSGAKESCSEVDRGPHVSVW